MSDESKSGARRPDDDTRCPTCGGSAHALNAITAPKFGGREYQHRYARKRLDEAWEESDRLAVDNDSTYAHLRAVIENCKHSPVEAIRHQLVGLLPEVRDMEPEQKQRLRDADMGHLVERHQWIVQGNWSDYGYGEPPEGWESRNEHQSQSAPHPPTPYVTVTLTLARQNAEALLSQEGLFPESYTPVGIGWMNLMQALREALEGGGS